MKEVSHSPSFYFGDFFSPQYEDFDGDAAVPSLHGMSPPESTLSDEELSVDQIKDLNNPDERVETEGAVLTA